MAGMHRDKCGAAAVAGFFQVPLSRRSRQSGCLQRLLAETLCQPPDCGRAEA